MTKFGLQELHLCEAIIREAVKKKMGKLVTSAKKEGGGLAKIMILDFYKIVTNLKGGGKKELLLLQKCPYLCFRGNSNQDQSPNKSIYISNAAENNIINISKPPY